MKAIDILHEITPLTPENCFILIDRTKSEFNYPVHVHHEYELNYVQGAAGSQRIVGDSIEEIGEYDLALITNPELEHAWFNHNCHSRHIREITIQFHPDLLDDKLLNRTQFKPIRKMFEAASKGITFPRHTIEAVRPRLENLCNAKGLHSVLEFIEVLHMLSLSTSVRILASSAFMSREDSNDSRRINKVIDYMNRNYDKQITLAQVAELISMSEVAFCRFFRKRTSRSPIEYLNDIRIGVATRQLADTAKPISEICFMCGFNNLSNFNRCFRKKKGCTPSEFRRHFIKTRQII